MASNKKRSTTPIKTIIYIIIFFALVGLFVYQILNKSFVLFVECFKFIILLMIPIKATLLLSEKENDLSHEGVLVLRTLIIISFIFIAIIAIFYVFVFCQKIVFQPSKFSFLCFKIYNMPALLYFSIYFMVQCIEMFFNITLLASKK